MHVYVQDDGTNRCSTIWRDFAPQIALKGMFVHHLQSQGCVTVRRNDLLQAYVEQITRADCRMFVTSKYGCSAIYQYDAIAGSLEVSTEV